MRRRGGARRRAYYRLVHQALLKNAVQKGPLPPCGLMSSGCRESAHHSGCIVGNSEVTQPWMSWSLDDLTSTFFWRGRDQITECLAVSVIKPTACETGFQVSSRLSGRFSGGRSLRGGSGRPPPCQENRRQASGQARVTPARSRPLQNLSSAKPRFGRLEADLCLRHQRFHYLLLLRTQTCVRSYRRSSVPL